MAPSTGQASKQALQLTQSSATIRYQPVPLVFSPSPFLMQSTGQTSTQELSPSQMSFRISYAMLPPSLLAPFEGPWPLVDLEHAVERDVRPPLRRLRHADHVDRAPLDDAVERPRQILRRDPVHRSAETEFLREDHDLLVRHR